MLKYRLRQIGRKKAIFWSATILIFLISITSIIRYYAISHAISDAHASGISGDTVYVNDLDADYYYYESLNYTELSTKDSLPSGENTNTYGVGSDFSKRLVAVQVTYDGRDVAGKQVNGSIATGYVSSTETQSKFVYYKYYPVENNKIRIELIDNPYTMRPTGYGFNGWYCDRDTDSSVSCDDMIFTHDEDYYIRYLEIPVTSSTTSLTINLRASWISATIANEYNTTAFSSFQDAGMRRSKNVKSLPNESISVSYDYYDHSDHYIAQAGMYRITSGPTQVTGNNNVPADSYVIVSQTGNSYTTIYYASAARCPSAPTSCSYLKMTEASHSDDPRNTEAAYNYTGGNYYEITSDTTTAGVRTMVFTLADSNGDWHQPRIKRRTNQVLTYANVPTGYNFTEVNGWNEDDNLVGHYYKKDISSGDNKKDYVNGSGENCYIASCNDGDTYKRLSKYENEGKWEYITLSTADGTLIFTDDLVTDITVDVPKYDINDYYTHVTRDINIINLSSGTIYLNSVSTSARNRPCTITSNYTGAKTDTNLYLANGSTSIYLGDDMVIENINLRTYNNNYSSVGNGSTSATYSIYGSTYNLKIGRGVRYGNNYSAGVVVSASNGNNNTTSVSNIKSRAIIESGRYTNLVGLGSPFTNSAIETIYGSDYDRVAGNNDNLILVNGTFGSFMFDESSTDTTPVLSTKVKSGTYGNNVLNGNTDATSYTAGVYVTQLRQASGGDALYKMKIEGGRIFNVSGGVSPGSNSKNVVQIYVTGGVIDNIFGGAGALEAYGNRLVSVTGGTVHNAVAGGSNSYTATTAAPLHADTLTYVGGTASLGGTPAKADEDGVLYAVAADKHGSVFGAGLGNSGTGNTGLVDNSHVIINGGTISGDVYGGGNYGATGTQTNDITSTVVDVLKGTIKGSVYGGANQNGAGYSGSTSTSCSCDGPRCLTESYYIIQNTVNSGVTIPNGTYYSRNSGSSFDDGSRVYRVNNNNTRCPNNADSCSIFALVNANTIYNASLDYYSLRTTTMFGTTYYYMNEVWNPSTCVPQTNASSFKHSVTINMSGGTVNGSVYGGSNSKGNVYADVTLNMTGGTVDNDIYGGGRGGVNGTTNNNVNSGTVVSGNITVNFSGTMQANNVYGGSAEGRVNGTTEASDYTTTVNISGGTVTNAVYGCGKGVSGAARPYTFGYSHVNVTGGTMGYVYGGNDASGTASRPTDVQLTGGTILHDAFGGGNNVGHETTNIHLNGTTINGDLYGGSNKLGAVTTANVTIDSGIVTNIFGGNNVAGSVNTTKVLVNDITTINGDVYGSGNQAATATTNVIIDDVTLKDASGKLRSVYGGGLAAQVTTSSNVLVKNGTMDSVFGGTNTNKDVEKSYVYITNGNFKNVYGGNNQSGTTKESNVYIGNGTIHATNDDDESIGGVYGGGKVAPTTTTNVYVYNGIMDNVFGGGSEADAGTTNVYMFGGTSPNVYGGSNTSGTVGDTNVDITTVVPACTVQTSTDNTVHNPCYTAGTRNVTDVYGGNNAGGETNNTLVSIRTGATLNDVFGGGNNAPVNVSTTVRMYDGFAKNVYGGGNKSYVGKAIEVGGNFVSPNGDPGNTYVYIAKGTIDKNVYGSGNASFVYGDTHVYIGDQAYSALNALETIRNQKITINGSVFGGSETNAKEGTRYDDSYVGVQGDTYVYIGANTYNKRDVTVSRSLYGGGNNSKVCDSCTSNIYINDWGTDTNIINVLSIQRSKNVYITDSVLQLNGDRDRALPTMYSYGFVRVGNLYVLGSDVDHGTTLHMRYGNYKLEGYNSGRMNATNFSGYNASNFVRQVTTVTDGTVSRTESNNKLYLRAGVIFAVANDEPKYLATTNVAKPVHGMTYLGMYEEEAGHIDYGMYNFSLAHRADVSTLEQFTNSYSFVYGLHEDNYDTQIKTNGFYSHFLDEDEGEENLINIDYVGVTPLNATYYKWILGKEKLQIRLTLQATKSTAKGAQLATIDLDELKDVIDEEGHTQDWSDATMKINYVDTSQFKASSGVKATWDVELIDKTRIPVVAENNMTLHDDEYGDISVSEANKYFALSMGTTTSGWLDNYKTNFYDSGAAPTRSFCSEEASANGECTGDESYVYDSTTIGRSLSFWLYYSKNLDFSVSTADESEEIVVIPLGEIKINTTFTNPHGDTSSTDSVKEVEIFVEVAMVDNKLSTYGSAITAGKQYDTFDSNPPVIAADGAFSIYQMVSVNLYPDSEALGSEEKWSANELYAEEQVVTEDGRQVTYSQAYRYLKSNYVYPVGTKITMLDMKTGEQYYYDVTSDKYNEKLSEYNASDEEAEKRVVQYKLSDFVKMGSTDTNNKYDDDMHGVNSTKYYSNVDGGEVAVEEFIFQVDFSGANPAQVDDTRDLYLYMELARDVSSDGNTYTQPSIIPAGTPVTDMKYNIYKNVSSSIESTGGFVTDDSDDLVEDISIYKKDQATLELTTNLVTSGASGVSISDTKFDDYQLGAKITIMKQSSDDPNVYEPITTDLFGAIATINGKEYYPQTDGSIRLRLAGRVTDVISDIQLDFSNSNLTFGDYKLVVETFASYDGLYYGDFSPEINEFFITLMNADYGIDVSVPPVQVTHDVNTGKDKTGSLNMVFALQTKNGLANPNVKVHLERRTYAGEYDTTYETIPLSGIADSITVDGGENKLTSCFASSASGDCNIYNLTGTLDNNLSVQDFEVTLQLKPGPSAEDLANMARSKWKSGTYRVVFAIYDGNTYIGEVYEYLIIRSLNVDEEVEGS